MILEAIQTYGFKLLMVVGAVFLAYLALQKYYEAETMQNLSVMRTEIESAYRGVSYSSLTNDIVIKGQFAPRGMIKNSSLVSSYGAVTVSGISDTKYSITLASLPQKACQDMASYSTDSWSAINVNGSNVLDSSTGTVGVDAAIGACQSAENVIQYVSR